MNVADDGCGFEQPLEAMLKATTPSSLTPTGGAFHAAAGEPTRSLGHGEDPATNGLWFRPDALLAIVYVSDEDDCSAANPAVYDPTSSTLPDPDFADHPFAEVDTRCDRYASELHDVQRYVDGLLAARPDPTSFMFVAITGVPTDLVDDPGGTLGPREGIDDLDAILADPRMQRGNYVSVDPADSSFPSDGRVRSVCVNASTRAAATPGIRAIEVARGLQRSSDGLAAVAVTSICNDDFHDATVAILTRIGLPITSSCFPHALLRDASGTVPCTLLEELPSGTRCDDLATNGRTYVRTQSEGDGIHEVCQIGQLPVTGVETGMPTVSPGHGWYYDDFSSSALSCGAAQPQRLSFTSGDEPPDRSRLTFECAKPGATCDGG